MATMQDFGGLLFGGGGTGLEDYLSADQQSGIRNQALLQAAAALLSAGGPSERPVSLGQALGGALQAGSAGYQQAQQGAVQSLVTRQKLEEAQRERQLQQYLLGGGMPTTQPVSGANAQPAPMGAPQQAGAGSLFSRLTPEQRALAAFSPKTSIPKILEEELKRENFSILTPAQATAMGLSSEGTYQQNARTGQVTSVVSAEATPTEVRLLRATNMPVTMENVMAIRRSGATNFNMGEGQKGFENEMNLKKMFSQEPIYKDFNDMQTAYKQVQSSLKQENPIGDVAAATKIMKLLDPGSVVRESELGIAMAAAGRMDRLQNYVTNWTQGTKLTPTQRQDFGNLATELYAAAGQTYNIKRGEIADLGSKYKLNANTALGAPATIPSIMKGSGSIEGAAQRKPLGAIFGSPQPQPQR